MVVKRKEADKRATGLRIRYVRETLLEMTQEEFAAAFRGKFTRGALGNWERGEGIKLSNLRLISERFRVSLDWLAAGVGETPTADKVLRPMPQTLLGNHANDLDVSVTQAQDDLDNGFGDRTTYHAKLPGALPELDVQLSAGQGTVGELFIMPGELLGHRVTAEWLLSNSFISEEARVTRSQAVILPIVGDSMFPSYSSGDRVIVDLSQRDLLQDAVFAISDGNSAPQIKRLQRIFRSNPEKVRIISDNPSYATEEHPLSDVHIIGRVCGVIARR